MDISELLGLPYPESDDPEAIALYMQDLAFKLEALLTEANSPTPAFLARPCAYWGNVGEAVGANSSTSIDWNTATPIAYQGAQSQALAFPSTPFLPEARHGLWLVGASAPVLTPSGTVNAGTERWLDITVFGIGQQFQTIGFTGSRDRNSFINNAELPNGPTRVTDLSYETNVGTPGNPLTVQCVAWIPQDAITNPANGSIARIEVDFGHRNTSSGFTLAANQCFLWAIWLGNGTDQIETV